jgi:malonate transporter
MLQIIGLVIPLFAVIAVGRMAVSYKRLDSAGLAALSGFTYWIALPALLIGSVAEAHAQNLIEVAAIYLACCIAVFAASMLLCYLFIGRSLARTAIFGLNATYGNVIFLGTPLVASFFGPQGVSLILAIIAFHSGVLLPLASVLIELGTHRQGGIRVVASNSAMGLLRNPIIMSILAGFIWRTTGFTLPLPLHHLFGLIGPAAAPSALFCLGASLPSVATEQSIMREAMLATVIKLAVLPFCVGIVSWQMGLTGLPWQVAVITAAMPTGANAFLLARRATDFVEASAATVVTASVASVLTITLILNWLH